MLFKVLFKVSNSELEQCYEEKWIDKNIDFDLIKEYKPVMLLDNGLLDMNEEFDRKLLAEIEKNVELLKKGEL